MIIENDDDIFEYWFQGENNITAETEEAIRETCLESITSSETYKACMSDPIVEAILDPQIDELVEDCVSDYKVKTIT